MTHRILRGFFAPKRARRNPNLHSLWKTESRDLYRNTEHAFEDHILLALSPEAGRTLLEKVPGAAIDSTTRAFLTEKVVPFLHDRTTSATKSWEQFEGIGLLAYDRGPFVGGVKVEWLRPTSLPDGFIDDLHRNGFASIVGEGATERGYFAQPQTLRADTPSKGQGAIRMATRERVSLPVAIMLNQAVVPNLSPSGLILRVGEPENGHIPSSFIAVTYRSPGPRGLVSSMKSLGFKLDAKLHGKFETPEGWSTYVLRPIA